jgi:transposase
VIGVDTHKHIHVAAVMDSVGGFLAALTIATDTAGFTQLLEWAGGFGKIIVSGIEGTGSYGAGLASFLRRHGHKVIEVSGPARRLRRLNGKSDSLDAENAARVVLAGFATAIPKTADGAVEMIRQLRVAHDTAVKDRSAAMITLKAMIVHAPEQLRAETSHKTKRMLAQHCAALRPRALETPDDSIRHTLRSVAKRWLALDEEVKELVTMIEQLVMKRAPHLLDEFGIGVDTAAEILIVAGDNPERIRSEAAFAKLAGISPIPASSGMTSGRHRVNHGGHRQLNAAIYLWAISPQSTPSPGAPPQASANATSSAA